MCNDYVVVDNFVACVVKELYSFLTVSVVENENMFQGNLFCFDFR